MAIDNLEGVKEALYKVFNDTMEAYNKRRDAGYSGDEKRPDLAALGTTIARVEAELRESKGLTVSKLPKAANG